ncbi:hypothetical protein JCM5353_008575 [Sporobolomyces roseus]
MSDRLTTLPFELFEMIVLFAQSNPRTKPLYVSKAFLPFVRPPVFKVTKIKSYERLETFLELINSTSAVIPFVIELEIKLEGKKDVGVPKNKALKTGFAQLIATEYVKLEGSSRIAKLLLAPSNDRALLFMGSLRIEDPLTGFQNPLDPSNFRWLSRYSNLHSLDLVITRDINDTGRRRNQSACAPVSSSNVNWQIDTLGLDGRFIRNTSLSDFISSFPNVHAYGFYEKTVDFPCPLVPFLDHLPHLGTDFLALTVMRADRENVEDFSSVLSKFSDLEVLNIGVGTFNNKVFDILNHDTFPNLTHLALRRGMRISIEQIKSFISGPKKLSKLEELELQIVVKDPENSGDGDYRYAREYDDVEGPLGLLDGITAQGLEEIVHLADKEGLSLTGYAAEFARREIESRKEDSKGRSRWERRYELYVEDDWY